MKLLKNTLLLMFACVFLIGCAQRGLYRKSSWSVPPASLRIVFDEPLITNPGDLERNMPEYVGHFSEWFMIRVAENISSISGQAFAVSSEKGALAIGSFTRKNKVDYVPMYSPMDQAEVYLLLTNISFGRDETEYYSGSNMGGAYVFDSVGGTNYGVGDGVGTYRVQRFFAARCRYAFYDAQTGNLLAYGDAEGKVNYTYNVSAEAWEKSMYNMVRRILKGTPLQ